MSSDAASNSQLLRIIQEGEKEVLLDWLKHQLDSGTLRLDLISEADLRAQSTNFLAELRKALKTGQEFDKVSEAWRPVRDILNEISRNRARLGFSPTETATFVFSLKQPVFDRIRSGSGSDNGSLMEGIWTATVLLDKLGLYTMEMFQQSREEVIARQQREMLELSTPVVTLWKGVLALPLIGTLDSARTQVVMESLLERIIQTESEIAIIDITGVPLVDTLVAQHLLKTVAAARLMGADCIISGIRPQIAQTIVHLGVDLSNVTTKATLADALQIALFRVGRRIVNNQPEG